MESEAAIAFGDGRVWGIFSVSDSDMAYLLAYDPTDDTWHMVDETNLPLERVAIAYQPGLQASSGAVWFAGNEDDGEDPMLYWYDMDEEELNDEAIDEFNWLGPGASLAHGRAGYPPRVVTYPNPGWLYCLRGGSREFWRYAIPYELVALDSVCPESGTVIGDVTPPFAWPASPDCNEYRLMLARDEAFSDVVLDVQTQSPSYQTTTSLEKGDHFWKTGTSDGFGGWSWSAVRDFRVDVGWVKLPPIGASSVEGGAALAFDYKRHYLNYASEALVAFPGGTDYRALLLYDVTDSCWPVGWVPTPHPQPWGTDLVTPTPDAKWEKPRAVFGDTWPSYPYKHDMPDWSWINATLPARLEPGASLAYAHHDDSEEVPQDWLYLILGHGSNEFWRLLLIDDDQQRVGGGQSGRSLPMVAGARIVSRGDELALEYCLEAAGPVRVTLCDVTGRVVATLHSGRQSAGAQELRWNPKASGVRAGAYFIVLAAGPLQANLKAIVR
ncbi:MAG: DUF4962 domain-containing protein [bacterium]